VPDDIPALQFTASLAKLECSPKIPEELAMSAFDEHRDELEHYETMMGPARGRLAVTLDLVTNAMVLVGQHAVYCRSVKFPEQPAMDIRGITKELTKAKELIQNVMEELRKEREARQKSN
jgi:hypothetical protein